MVDQSKLSEDRIQDYIDGRLNEQDRAAVAAHLLAHPDEARIVQELRQQNDALKGLGAEVLSEPVPDRLKAIVSEARHSTHAVQIDRAKRAGFMQAAAILLIFCLGGAAGWFGRDFVVTGPNVNDLALEYAFRAYNFYASANDYPLDFPADRESDLASWFERAFERPVGRPDLAEIGYNYVGGRLLPWSRGSQGLFIYRNEKEQGVAVFFWPSDSPRYDLRDLTREKKIASRFWWGNGFGFAIMSDPVNEQIDDITKAVSTFYAAAKAKTR